MIYLNLSLSKFSGVGYSALQRIRYFMRTYSINWPIKRGKLLNIWQKHLKCLSRFHRWYITMSYATCMYGLHKSLAFCGSLGNKIPQIASLGGGQVVPIEIT